MRARTCPTPSGLESYDGIVLTGSHLNIYDRTPEILRQIDLMRAVYASRTPSFGSCWGHPDRGRGGRRRRAAEPVGREIGFARRLTPHRSAGAPTRCWTAGPLPSTRRPSISTWSTALPGDCTVLATNAVSAVQAAEIRQDGGTFWGVQYHPEFSLGELAVILGRRTEILVREGFCRTPEDAASYVADLAALHDRARHAPISPGGMASMRRSSTRSAAPARSATSSSTGEGEKSARGRG